MSSYGRSDGNVDSDQSTRPRRERKQAQHFGHSKPSANLEELVSTLEALLRPQTCSNILIVLCLTDIFQIEASQLRTIAPAVRNGGATKKPSLWVTLPLPPTSSSQAPSLPPSSSFNAPTIKIESTVKAQVKPASRNPRKRAAVPDNDDDDSNLFAPSSSREPAPKRQRVGKSTGTQKARSAIKVEEDGRPEPRGQPEVWAEVFAISSST